MKNMSIKYNLSLKKEPHTQTDKKCQWGYFKMQSFNMISNQMMATNYREQNTLYNSHDSTLICQLEKN